LTFSQVSRNSTLKSNITKAVRGVYGDNAGTHDADLVMSALQSKFDSANKAAIQACCQVRSKSLVVPVKIRLVSCVYKSIPFINGHEQVLAGCDCGSSELLDIAKRVFRKQFGPVPDDDVLTHYAAICVVSAIYLNVCGHAKC
jgi:hypothetical protein